MTHIAEPGRQLPIVDHVDVAVIGGGPAGIHAAVAAARQGATVCLVERYGFAGGMATAGLVGPILGVFHCPTKRRILGGTPFEMLSRMASLDGAILHHPERYVPFDPEILKYVADQMLTEAGVHLRYHSFAARALVSAGRIEAIVVESKSGRQAIRARVFVDTTGDGDVGASAGARFELGRPGDGALQPSTLCFRLGGVELWKHKEQPDLEHHGWSMESVRKLLQAAVERGELPRFGGPWIMYGSTVRQSEAFVNMVRLWGNATDVETITANEITGRSHMMQFVRFLKDCVDWLRDAYILDSGTQIGVRETRRFVGQYVLTEEDIVSGHPFPDSIAVGGHVIDIHSPDGTIGQRRQVIGVYQIPFRCLVPVGVSNLLVAGRPVSATHEAHSSLRVMGTCMALGQAAGVAAAMAAGRDASPGSLDGQEVKAAVERMGGITA